MPQHKLLKSDLKFFILKKKYYAFYNLSQSSGCENWAKFQIKVFEFILKLSFEFKN